MDIEQKLEEPEKRRKQGAGDAAAGSWRVACGGCSAGGCFTPVGVALDEAAREKGGMAALWRTQRFGRPSKLDDAQRAELIKALKAGALAAGFTSELWTLPHIGMLIKKRFGVEFSQSSVRRRLQQLGWSVQ